MSSPRGAPAYREHVGLCRPGGRDWDELDAPGEQVTARTVVGVAVIITGVTLIVRSARRGDAQRTTDVKRTDVSEPLAA